MHSKTLKRKVAEDMEVADFIAQWSPIHSPNYSHNLVGRPTKALRTNKALAVAGKADFFVPDAPPNSPNSAKSPKSSSSPNSPDSRNSPDSPKLPVTSRSSRAKGKAKAASNHDTFQPSPIQKSWIKKKPFLEAKYRRNHKLKTDFADTSVPLKVALLELASRTLKKLEEDEHWHEKGDNALSHYLVVQQLEKRLNGKIDCYDTHLKLQMATSEHQYEYDKKVINDEFKV